MYVLLSSGDNKERILLALNKLTDTLKTTNYSCKKKQIICIISPNPPPLSLKVFFSGWERLNPPPSLGLKTTLPVT
jgi:hypothetical protein